MFPYYGWGGARGCTPRGVSHHRAVCELPAHRFALGVGTPAAPLSVADSSFSRLFGKALSFSIV
jgi:hypothetical protein